MATRVFMAGNYRLGVPKISQQILFNVNRGLMIIGITRGMYSYEGACEHRCYSAGSLLY